MKIQYGVLALILVVGTSSAQQAHKTILKHQSQFIVTSPSKQKKIPCKRALKEDMGDELQELMKVCASIHKALGTLQLSLARMQKRFVSTGSALLSNKAPIKKAKKQELHDGVQVLQKVTASLGKQVRALEQIEQSIQQAPVLQAS